MKNPKTARLLLLTAEPYSPLTHLRKPGYPGCGHLRRQAETGTRQLWHNSSTPCSLLAEPACTATSLPEKMFSSIKISHLRSSTSFSFLPLLCLSSPNFDTFYIKSSASPCQPCVFAFAKPNALPGFTI